ncbi:MAG: fatty acid desaturase [Acidobacteriota bacterium]
MSLAEKLSLPLPTAAPPPDDDVALSETDDFTLVDTAEPHTSRARAMLRAHPEIRELVGPAPSTFLLTLALVAGQNTLALLLRNSPLWMIALVAYFVGAVMNCAVLNMIHEACHNLIFRSRRWNLVAAYIANLGTFSPYVETFYHYHLPHHRFLGIYDRDTTIARDWEARLVGRSALRKLVWFVFFPLIYPFRVARMSIGKPARHRLALNLVLQIAWLALLYSLGGWRAVAYLALSFYLHFGLHPLNAIALQEHVFVKHGEESYSYYGIGNWITFNAGYHVEHHDLPCVPWSRLRRLHAIAPEFYEGRYSYQSWTGLILRFVKDRQWSLWARAVREDRKRARTQNA